MTTLMKKLIDQLQKLPEEEQDSVAAFLLEEVNTERRWDELFDNSQEELSRMADEAIEEFERGETKPLEDSFTS